VEISACTSENNHFGKELAMSKFPFISMIFALSFFGLWRGAGSATIVFLGCGEEKKKGKRRQIQEAEKANSEKKKSSNKKMKLKKRTKKKEIGREKKNLIHYPSFLKSSIFFLFVYQSKRKYNKVPLSSLGPTGTAF
jgi:hypothetical protein